MRNVSIAVANSRLRILQRDLKDDVPGVAAAIDDFFQQSVKIAEKNDLFRLVFALEKIAEAIRAQACPRRLRCLAVSYSFPAPCSASIPFRNCFTMARTVSAA